MKARRDRDGLGVLGGYSEGIEVTSYRGAEGYRGYSRVLIEYERVPGGAARELRGTEGWVLTAAR
jgi:hypothetical protein